MDAGLSVTAGRCRRCQRPFTSGEVTGLGILRPRRLEDGGPWVDFACPECRTVNPLVPHGAGRFAPPGAPPPPPPSEIDRQVPWHRGREAPPPSDGRPPTPARASRPPPTAPPPPVASNAPPQGPPVAPPVAPGGGGPAPLDGPPTTVHDALEVLGVPAHAGAADIERAYRALALKLHPDKVAHLDADFVALAERKFRRLQAARDLLLGPG